MMPPPPDHRDAASPDADRDAPATPPPRRISSQALFAGSPEVHIEHHGAVYRLRETQLGKLILTK